MLAFLHHFSPWLHVGVLVKHRLLGMTGGGRAPQATEESPPRTPLSIGINWFLGFIFSPYGYVGVSDIE